MLIDEVLTAKEAEDRWKLASGQIRQLIFQTPDRFIKGEVRKSSSIWLITRDAMVRHFGKEPEQ
ncbi:helix-turn-helix domain-containing protein [Negativicoccus succinicivorans]|uniref:helix-turn-helix domain-containing protein n=1 Tax=Negativicoccus succinicivorans TaxID=620903 RepID=UPI002900E22C|nr:helix-turn-helix domain-containing protein [Negativicoccus succinicivorans]MDU2418285.1 helix-turn-helix domain-containing protein [Negativicoccus succinicivorans]